MNLLFVSDLNFGLELRGFGFSSKDIDKKVNLIPSITVHSYLLEPIIKAEM
jgi:hypothetical protein